MEPRDSSKSKESGRSGGLAFPERPRQRTGSRRACGVTLAVLLRKLPPPFGYNARFRFDLHLGIAELAPRAGQFDPRWSGNIAIALGVLSAKDMAISLRY